MKINLNNKKFVSSSNSKNGDVDVDTLFHYHQEGETIWAEYSGGDISKGSLIGKFLDESTIEFNYNHICKNGELKAGTCKSTIVTLESGKIKLKENWQWFTGDQSKGYSEIVEK